MQKHCSKLWNGLVIRHNGNVFPCCQRIDDNAIIGNINQQPLKEIVNGERIQELRQLSLEGRLSCYDTCDQARYFESFPVPRPKTVEADIEEYADLQIEYGEICNVDCIMCWQDRKNKTQLSFDILSQNLPLESWQLINVYGGEVFAMKEAMRHVELMRQAGKNIMMTTNGKTLSNRELARWVVMTCKHIIVSINAMCEETHTFVMRPKVPFFHQLLESIKNLQVLKHEVGNPQFSISGHFTVVKESLHEFPLFIEQFESLGFDTATIGFDHRHFPRFFTENPGIVQALAPKVRKAMRSVKDPSKVTLADQGIFGASENRFTARIRNYFGRAAQIFS
jgi:radical SAM protein with 4Fe4S-binding SPASM domain